jgi:hypothetical protein
MGELGALCSGKFKCFLAQSLKHPATHRHLSSSPYATMSIVHRSGINRRVSREYASPRHAIASNLLYLGRLTCDAGSETQYLGRPLEG